MMAATMPLWAAPVLGIGGAALGSLAVHRAIANRGREVRETAMKDVCFDEEFEQ